MSPRQAKGVKGRVGDDPATALRNHLIDVAERLLAERPVSSITTRDIARAGEVSDGVLYNYFASKNDLLVDSPRAPFRRIVAGTTPTCRNRARPPSRRTSPPTRRPRWASSPRRCRSSPR